MDCTKKMDRNIANDMHNKFKSGFIAITGAPNAGKSTFLNYVLGQKISITSEKPQTTRNQIRGIVNRPLAQLVFIDTPGIFKARTSINSHFVDVAVSAMQDSDLILVVIDSSNKDPESESIILNHISMHKKPVILAPNKIDLIEKAKVLPMIDKWSKAYKFADIIPISAKRGTQIEDLMKSLENLLPEGELLFPKESLTDLPERFFATEMIREKIFRFAGQEIPYATFVTIDTFSEDKEKSLTNIYATIHVERDSQKGIIIGKSGQMLKKIGERARKDIEDMIGSKVFLKLFVRVQKDWRKDEKIQQRFGF